MPAPGNMMVVIVGWTPWRWPYEHGQREPGFAAYRDGDVVLAVKDQMLSRTDDEYDFIVRHVELPEMDEYTLEIYVQDRPHLWKVPTT